MNWLNKLGAILLYPIVLLFIIAIGIPAYIINILLALTIKLGSSIIFTLKGNNIQESGEINDKFRESLLKFAEEVERRRKEDNDTESKEGDV